MRQRIHCPGAFDRPAAWWGHATSPVSSYQLQADLIKSAQGSSGDLPAQVLGCHTCAIPASRSHFSGLVLQCAGSLSLHSLAHLSDFLAGCQTSVQEDRSTLQRSPLLMCKALSSLARIGQVRILADLMVNPFQQTLRRMTGEKPCLCLWHFWQLGNPTCSAPGAHG